MRQTLRAGAKARRLRALHLYLSSTCWPSDDAAGALPEHDAAARGRTCRRLTRQRLARRRGACRSAHVLRHPQEACLRAASARRRPGHKHVQARKSCTSWINYAQVHLRLNSRGGSFGGSPGSILVATSFDAAYAGWAAASRKSCDRGASLPSCQWGNWLHCNPYHFRVGSKRSFSWRQSRPCNRQACIFYSRYGRRVVGDGKNKKSNFGSCHAQSSSMCQTCKQTSWQRCGFLAAAKRRPRRLHARARAEHAGAWKARTRKRMAKRSKCCPPGALLGRREALGSGLGLHPWLPWRGPSKGGQGEARESAGQGEGGRPQLAAGAARSSSWRWSGAAEEEALRADRHHLQGPGLSLAAAATPPPPPPPHPHHHHHHHPTAAPRQNDRVAARNALRALRRQGRAPMLQLSDINTDAAEASSD